MANLQFQNATIARRKTLGKVQTAENIRISVKNDIAEVLSVGVDNIINSYDVTDGEVTFYGKTAIKFLYNDGAGIAGANYNADFTASLQNEELNGACKCCFDVVTVDSKVDTNANTATITVLLEVTAYAYIFDNVTYLADAEDAFARKESAEILQNADIVNLPVVIDEELTATRTITTVLLAESALCICDYTNVDNVLRISGDATVHLTYLSEGEIVTDSLPFKFDRELDSTDIPANAQLQITPYVRQTKVRLNIAEDSVNTEFTVEIAASLCTEYCETAVLDVVTDAYGSDCDFTFQRQSITTTLPCGSTVAQKHAQSTLPLENGKSVLSAVNAGALVTKCTSLEKSAQVEGVIFATALYQTETGTESAQLELPFIQTVDIDYLAPQCASCATVTVTDFQLTENNGLQVSADLCISVDSSRDIRYTVISEGEEKLFDKSQLPAIEVCLAHKGETLWELGKALHMSEEDLVAVNPEITSPLERDARIVVYNKI